MRVFVQTADAGETVSVGILSTEVGGDADGFLKLVSVATAGWVRPRLTFTAGSSQYYVSATTFGELFAISSTGGYKGLAGADGAGTAGQPWMESHIGDGTAESISYTCSSGTDAFVGFLAFRWRVWSDLTGYLV
jgi:hypothetical protein